MTRSLKVLLATGVMLVLLGACPSQAQDCRSLSQARRANPDVHLYYRLEGRKAGGRKCWYARAEDRPRYRIVAQKQRETAREEERRSFFEEVFSYFLPRPAAEEEEEQPKPRKSKGKKPVKQPESPRSIDAKVFDLCGPFDTGICSGNVRARRE